MTRNRMTGCWFHLAEEKHKRQAAVNLQVSVKCGLFCD
jgi:hypothetical protein